jgi:peptidoglycan/xylan/chitin deacetylase (PgdA/CDA1 family)
MRLMFDDGNASDVDIAFPRLVKRGLKAEFFILADRLVEPGRLDRNGVRELLRAGMTVGSHGWADRDWRKISPAEAYEEISMANRVIAELTGEPVPSVAIPYGSYDQHVLYRLRRAELVTTYTSDVGRPPHGRAARLTAARTAKRLRGQSPAGDLNG